MKTLHQFLEQGDPQKEDPKLKQDQKRENMLKKRVLMTKMRAVRGGATGIMASHEPEGEQLDETPKGDVGKDPETVQRRRNEDQNRRRGDRGSRLPDKAQELRKREHKERRGAKTGPLRSGKQPDKLSQDVSRLRRITDKFASQAHRKEEVVYEGDVHSGQGEKIQKRTKAWMDKKGQKGAPGLDAMKARTAEHKAKRGVKEEVVDEGVMKFIKDKVGSKKKPEKKPEMDKTTDKLHNLRKDKFKTDRQKEHEKFVNFLDVDEEFVTELNRYGKETGKATGSLNKRPGKPVGKKNEPNSPVNTVRRMIRRDTGRPEGQQKKVKGSPRGQQPGDRKLTPAQTISRMRAQVAAADAAMRDTRGT